MMQTRLLCCYNRFYSSNKEQGPLCTSCKMVPAPQNAAHLTGQHGLMIGGETDSAKSSDWPKITSRSVAELGIGSKYSSQCPSHRASLSFKSIISN